MKEKQTRHYVIQLNKAVFIALLLIFIPPKFRRCRSLYSTTILAKKYCSQYIFLFFSILIAYYQLNKAKIKIIELLLTGKKCLFFTSINSRTFILIAIAKCLCEKSDIFFTG